jgi:hypothetical protein
MNNLEPKSDYRLAIGYGSAWHLLRCLGWRRDAFSDQIAAALYAASIRWLDFPGYKGKQVYPSKTQIRDGEWTRLDFIDDEEVQRAYDKFWPLGRGQQNWDAIGKAEIDGEESWLLVEAKAHSAEIHSRGTTASEDGGRPMIRNAFKQTLLALGHNETDAAMLAERWLTGYYQHANRLATLHFLTTNGIPARLVFVYFCGDRHPDGKDCPATADEWNPTLDEVHAGLGLHGVSELESRVHNVFVNVDRRENS